MSYIALARKYRPQNFDEIIAQDVVVKTLTNAIELGRVSHAYLFTGPRGVGKTSAARIFAKAINCLEPDGMNPCGKCDNCIEITAGTSIDVIEIDGASNRGIDEIRQLRETVKFIPVKCTYKVYILDEVHMLTDAAFNALLKTLEEPPAHAIFIMATTESQKIPMTILSRSQKYNFNKIPFKFMKIYIEQVLSKEQIKFEDDAINIVVRNSDGCMRDALSLVDQIIAFGDGKLLVENTNYLLGTADSRLTEKLLTTIIKENVQEIPDIIEDISIKGIEYKFIVESLISHVRHLLLGVVTKEFSSTVLTGDEKSFYNELLPGLDESKLFALFQVLQKLLNDLKYFSFERYVFEFGMFKCASVSRILPSSNVGIAPVAGVKSKLAPYSVTKIKKENAPVVSLDDNDLKWQNFLRQLSELKPIISSNLGHGYISSLSKDELIIGFTEEKKFHFNLINKPDNIQFITNAVKEYFTGVQSVRIQIEGNSKKKTVIEKTKEIETFRSRKIKKEAVEDPMVIKIKEEFSGVVQKIEVLPDN